MSTPLPVLVAKEILKPLPREVKALSDALHSRYGQPVQAVLFYGSCLRDGCGEDALLDLCVLVDRYSNVYPSRRLALANALLPPNVFYLEIPFNDRTIRAKYAIVSLAQFRRVVSPRCFQSYFWARFAQPCAAVYFRDTATSEVIAQVLAGAVQTFVARVVPLLPPVFDATVLWQEGLRQTYRTELRPERAQAALQLAQVAAIRYRDITHAALSDLPFPITWRLHGGDVEFTASLSTRIRLRSRLVWCLRRVQGKFLNVLRLSKAAFTFTNGVDYILWKIERHSGIRVEATPQLRRHPLLAGWGIVWRLYRCGAFR